LRCGNAFTDAFCAQLPATTAHDQGRVVVELDDRYLRIVEAVRANCDDNAREMGIDDEHDLDEHPEVVDDVCASLDLVVEQDGKTIERDHSLSMTSAEAIGSLITAVELTGRHERDPSTAQAIKVATMILEQRGCEHFDSASDGSLTHLIDIVTFGGRDCRWSSRRFPFREDRGTGGHAILRARIRSDLQPPFGNDLSRRARPYPETRRALTELSR
jgi:hypothetical protein